MTDFPVETYVTDGNVKDPMDRIEMQLIAWNSAYQELFWQYAREHKPIDVDLFCLPVIMAYLREQEPFRAWMTERNHPIGQI